MDYSKIAYLYDLYATSTVDVPFFIEETHGCLRVLELMSGTGRLSIPLIEAGAALSCLDSSPEMLAILHEKLAAKGYSVPVYEMDVCQLALPDRFDLILIPFNAFAEITEGEEQAAALSGIRLHLSDGGRLIVTLHNPAVRLKGVDGQARLRGQFPLPQEGGTLALSSVECYDDATSLVTGVQIYEIFDAQGALQSKLSLELKFCLHSREEFEALARAQGFVVEALYGNYDRSAFDAQESPYMIWKLAN